MKSLLAFGLSLLASLATASTLAPHLPDGFYHTYTDDLGV
jgi:hypothetical protein